MLKIYIGRNAGRAVCLTLPATREETDRAFADIGSAGSEVPVLIQEAETSVPHLEERLKGLSYEKKEDREALDFLAERIGYLTQEEQDVFSAVFRMEDPGSLEETINLSYNLDQYKLLPFGFDQEELSRILVKRDTGVEIPVEVAEFLDHEKVYSAYFLHHKGEFCPSGLVLKKEGAVVEAVYGNGRYTDPGYEKDSLLLLHLYKKDSGSDHGDHVLSVPASAERIALARERLGVENLDVCGFYSFCARWEDLTDYLPAGMGAEEINQAAAFFMDEVLDGTKEHFRHLLAVLEAECPRTLEEVLEVAGNLKDYRGHF